MKKIWLIKLFLLAGAFLPLAGITSAQTAKTSPVKSQEVSEIDGVPVLIKHLPDWENVRNSAVFTNSAADLRKTLGERPIIDLIDFAGGTEAVTAAYPQGKLLIVEYATPQGSVEMDGKAVHRLAADGAAANTFYRRIGNYNVFVFDAPDEAAAVALLDQVKYEKNIQWLGENPFLLRRAERAFIETTSDIFFATVMIIVLGIGLSILTGIVVGIVFFYLREQKRSTMTAFSDAGGMVRLNLDDLTQQTAGGRFLNE